LGGTDRDEAKDKSMLTEERTDSRDAELEGTIERRIAERTWGRVHWLRVAVSGGRAVVSGYAPSYYIKQLAIQAALEALGMDGTLLPILDIQVGSGESQQEGRPVVT
jgi:hypothetical protein